MFFQMPVLEIKISKDMGVEMIGISVFMYVYHADVIIFLPESLICGHLFSLSHMNQKQTFHVCLSCGCDYLSS